MIFGGKIKTTEVIEQERIQLWNDYQTYLKVEQSDGLRTYLTLKERVESTPFQEKKKEIETLQFKGSSEEKILKQYQKLANNRKLLRYFELTVSPGFERFVTIEKSGIVKEFEESKVFVHSNKYKKAYSEFKKGKIDKDKWGKSDFQVKYKYYDELRKSPDVLFYQHFIKTRGYKNYLKVKGSSLLNQYEDLKTEVESDKFKERKKYLEDTKRYENTDDFNLLSQYNKLNTDAGIQLYMKYNDSDAFKFYRGWSSTFSDDFEKIDKKTWAFISPIAEKGPGRNFTLSGQLQYPNFTDNFDVENSILTLETQKEKVEGLVWDKAFGFIPKTFNYTSGIAHSLNVFKQEYGYFSVKMKASKVKGVISSISLVDEDEETCIRLFTANGKDIKGGLVITDRQTKKFVPVKFKVPSKGYMIISLKWTPEKLEWHVNERQAGTITENIPHIPLGLRIETEVLKETSNLPHRLDIDWIRCYKKG